MAVSRRPIMVGVDGSAPSLAATSWAAAEACRHQVQLHLVIAGDPARADYAEDTVREVAARGRRECPDLEVTEEVVVDHPVHALVHRSAEAQMLVVGFRGRSDLVNALLGAVSASVVARSACPVVVVRSGRARLAREGTAPAAAGAASRRACPRRRVTHRAVAAVPADSTGPHRIPTVRLQARPTTDELRGVGLARTPLSASTTAISL